MDMLIIGNEFDLAHELPTKYEDFLKFTGQIFSSKVQQENVQRCIWSDFIDKTYQDLQDLVRCLEIYLDDCVSKIAIPSISCRSRLFRMRSASSVSGTSRWLFRVFGGLSTDRSTVLINTFHQCRELLRDFAL